MDLGYLYDGSYHFKLGGWGARVMLMWDSAMRFYQRLHMPEVAQQRGRFGTKLIYHTRCV